MKKISFSAFVISIVGTIILCVIIFLNLDNITELFSGSDIVSTGQTLDVDVGDTVFLSGQMTAEGDYVTHTHTLFTEMYGAIGLKSSTRNLGSYNGIVGITGTLVDIFDNLYVVQVSDIAVLSTGDAATGDIVATTGLFIRSLGLYLKPSFFVDYDYRLVADGVLTLFDRSTSQALTISSFGCRMDASDKNCTKLASAFAGLAPQKYVSDEGVTVYRQSEATSWYAHTEYFGYFYNDWDDNIVLDMHNHIDYINNRRVQNNLVSLCISDNDKLQRVSDISLSFSSDVVEATITGSGKNGSSLVCVLIVDPSIPHNGLLKSIQISSASTESVATGTNTQDVVESPKPTTNTSIPDVDQFPLKPEKGLVYKTTMGHSITFPSPNISYASAMVDTDLGFAGTRCSIQINVVAYPQKDLLQTQPSVQVYECRRVSDTLDGWYVRYDYEDIFFVVRVVDPAWFDFARGLVIAPSV